MSGGQFFGSPPSRAGRTEPVPPEHVPQELQPYANMRGVALAATMLKGYVVVVILAGVWSGDNCKSWRKDLEFL